MRSRAGELRLETWKESRWVSASMFKNPQRIGGAYSLACLHTAARLAFGWLWSVA